MSHPVPFPWPSHLQEWRTERLLLRELLPSDAEIILALRSDARVNRYLDRNPCKDLQEALEFIRGINLRVSGGESLYWALALKDSGKMTGTLCLWNFSPDRTQAEIGYELLPQYQGQGIMKEAVRAVLGYGFESLGLERISAWSHPENLPSIRLLMDLAFSRDQGKEELISAPQPEHSFFLLRDTYNASLYQKSPYVGFGDPDC